MIIIGVEMVTIIHRNNKTYRYRYTPKPLSKEMVRDTPLTNCIECAYSKSQGPYGKIVCKIFGYNVSDCNTRVHEGCKFDEV